MQDVVLGDFIVRVAVWFAQLPEFPVLLPLVIVLGLPTTLIHELGHGIAANRIAKVGVRIEISFIGVDWMGLCRLQGGREISVRDYGIVIAAGPLASLTQGFVAAELAAATVPGTALYAILATFALTGYLAGALNLVPFVHGALRSDGRLLLDLGRWLLHGRAADWIAAAREPVDPHAATSVAPPG